MIFLLSEEFATMLATAIFLAALSLAPGESGRLSVSNVRTTYGPLGPTRPNNQILPGDLVCLCFDVQGFQVNSAGKIHYGVGLEATDSKGRMVFKNEPSDVELASPTSGQSVPICAKVDVGLASPPGKYDLNVTIVDRTAGTKASVTRSYELVPLKFGIVRVSLTSDREGQNSAEVFSQGKPGWINFTAVGFGRDKVQGQPRVTVTMRVLDQSGRSVLPEPSSGTINQGVPPQVGAVPMQFRLLLAQTGRFTVELKATDDITGQSATVTFPIQIVASK
jgi:hypothetical protein